MRPLPVILLLVALASALVAGLFLLGRGDANGAAARTAASADRADATRAPGENPGSSAPALDAASAERVDSNRAASAPAHDAALTGSAPKAKKDVPTVALGGRVLGNLGKPIEGATVYAAASNDLLAVALDEIDPEITWIRRVEAKTDRDGRFRIQPEAGAKVALAVRAPGFAPLDREFSISGAERDLGDLTLDPSVVLSGRVVDPGGRPVAGARIARLSGPESGLPFFGGPRGAAVATTDDQGAFRVDQLAAGGWRLLVTHEDHPDHVESGTTDRAGAVVSELVVTLEEGSDIQGRVVGAPPGIAPKLSLRAVPRSSGEGSIASDNPLPLGTGTRTARCAADGSFTLRGLKRSQSYRLTAQESTRGLFRGSRSASVNAQSGDRGVELAYKPETAIVFQVVDARTQKPVVDLAVQAGFNFLLPLTDEDGRAVKSFPDGRVRYGGLPSAPRAAGAAAPGLKLHIEAPGYQTFERSDVAVAEGQDTDLGVVRLEPAPVVAVLVLDDATGSPIADAVVRLSEETPKPAHGTSRVAFTIDDDDSDDSSPFVQGTAQRARTGPDGKASVTSLPGKTARISVHHAGYAKFLGEPIALPVGESLDQTVRLSVGGSVTVEVVDSRGAPVVGAEIEHQVPGVAGVDAGPSSPVGRSGPDGRAVFDHLAAGTHQFRLQQGSGNGVFNVGGGGRAVVRRVSRIGGGEDPGWSSVEVDGRTAATLRLVAPERGSLAGRVTETGQPLANATLNLSPKSEEELPAPFRSGGRSTRTDSRGEYVFDGVEEGEYTVSVEHATRAMASEATTRVRAGENRFDLDLPVAIVEGTVTGEDGKPVAGARVHAERAPAPGSRRPRALSVMVVADGGDEPQVSVDSSAGAGPTATTDADGHYSLRGVLADVELVVEANAKDVQPARSEAFTAKPDDVKKHVDLKLERGGAIQVTVRRAGKPAGGFLARATMPAGEGAAPTAPKVQVVGPGGTTKLTGLKPGKWRVNLDSIGGPLSGGSGDSIPEKEVDVQVGETAQATFDVP